MSVRFPCKNCPDRKPACHDTCKKYQECAKKKKIERDGKSRDSTIKSDVIYRIDRMRGSRRTTNMKIH